jgi:hypothetical protein
MTAVHRYLSIVSNWFSRAKIRGFNGHVVAVAGLIASFLIIFRDIIFYPKLMLVVDFGIPSTSPYYHVLYFITSWAPHNLGFTAIPGWSGLLTGFFVFLSVGNQIVAQKLMLLQIPLASIFMYYFIIQHITKSKSSAFTGAILYGYSPIVLDNFATQLLWGYAFLPIILNYILNVVEGKPKVRDAIILGLVMTFASSMTPHLLGIVPPLFALFFAVHLLRKKRISYVTKVFKYSLLAISIYIILSLQSYALSILSGGGKALSFVGPSLEQFYANYQGLSVGNLIRMTGIGNPLIHPVHYLYLQGNDFGFILPILAFSALFVTMRIYHKTGRVTVVISTRRRNQVYALSFSLLVLITILFVESILNRAFLFEWFYANYPPLITLRNPLAVMMLVSLAYAILISITSTFIQRQLLRSIKKLGSLTKRRALVGVLVCSLILGAYFLYAPAYDSGLQKSTPYLDFPSVYSEAVNWMRNQGEDGDFRYLLVPQSHSSQLYLPNSYPYQFLAVSGASYPSTYNYVMLAYDALVQNQTSRFGSLLAAANVKYVIIPLNTTEPPSLNWMTEGPIRISGDNLVGNSTDFIAAMKYQTDLQLIEQQNNFLVYQVENFIPKVATFQNAIYVVGDSEALVPIIELPGYTPQNNLLIFGENQSLDYNTTMDCAPTILLYNLDNAQIQELVSRIPSDKNVIMLYDRQDFFEEKTNVLNLELAPLDSVEGVSILHGTGTVTTDTIIKPKGAQASVTYNGTSQGDTLFSIIYSFRNPANLTGVDEIRYYFRLSGARESQNVEFGLIDDSGIRARRWYTNTLPAVQLDTWQEVTINLTSYSQQNEGFNISAVRQLQFTTYTSQPQMPVTMWVSNVTGTKVASQELDFSTRMIESGNYSISFKSLTAGSAVTIDGVATSLENNGAGWYETKPTFLSGDYANVSIIMPLNGEVDSIAFVNKPTLEDVFSTGAPSVSYSVKEASETKYVVQLETEKPVFLVLGESYDPSWSAQVQNQNPLHFPAFSWSNGYYVDSSGNLTITIEFEQQTQHILLSAFTFSVFFVSSIFALYDFVRHPRRKKREKKF